MKVLLINSWSHEGSTGKITFGLFQYLNSHGHHALLCCRGTRESKINDSRIIPLVSPLEHKLAVLGTRITGYDGVFNRRATRKVIKLIEEFKPDIIQLFNLHAYYLNSYELLEYLKKKPQTPVVYVMFDEFPYMGRCCFSVGCNQFKTECVKCPHQINYPRSLWFDRASYCFKRKKKIYQDFSHITFASVKWCCERAKESALLKHHRILELDNPINYDDVFYPRNTEQLKKDLGIPYGNKVIMTVAVASIPTKGGKYFVELAQMMQNHKDITFVYVGYDVNDWDIPQNMITIGFVKSQDLLAQYYSMADLFVCTSLADLTPNACLDALGCGTPLAGFSEGGVPYCASEEFGTFVKTFDMNALAEVVEKTPKKTEKRIKDVRDYAYNRYSSNLVYEKYVKMYKSILENNGV